MKISLAWLNSVLSPGGLSAAEAEALLTSAGFPIESTTPVAVPGGTIDQCLDVEVTSNRGDALCHLTLAAEIAAVSDGKHRVFRPKMDAPASDAGVQASSVVALRNEVTRECPRFTLRVIKGVKVGRSPAWLVDRLAAIGQRSINNVVDVTNYVQSELGNPSHVFDLDLVRPSGDGTREIVVRGAAAGEKLEMLDGKTVTLAAGELVVADAGGPISLAGIMGGQSTGVSERTKDVLVEVATWSPVMIRKAARRLNITSDASHRFQRVVSARTINLAADRITQLIVELAGGKLLSGTVEAGAWSDEPVVIALRGPRVRRVIGVELTDAQIERALAAQGFSLAAGAGSGEWTVKVPAIRNDVKLEIDLIEEIARTIGYDKIVVPELMPVRINEPQRSERAGREAARVLTGCGFFETVTFSFTSAKLAKPFIAPGVALTGVSDDRRGSEGTLRPSVLCGLLACRRVNQDRRADVGGGVGGAGRAMVKLYEIAAAFGEDAARPGGGGGGATIERQTLAMLSDLPSSGSAFERRQLGVRQMRGAIEAVVLAMHGPSAALRFEPVGESASVSALYPDTSARVVIGTPSGDLTLGTFGIIDEATQKLYELENPVIVAELAYDDLIAPYPARVTVMPLPTMGATERDLSLIVDEATGWDRVRRATLDASPQFMESLAFVTTYRGKPIPDGKKSLTFRMRFRHPEKTLRDEEVNAPVDALVARLKAELGAEVRTG
jgi:phenylalanyl-tRNA synthetase beta chain